MEKEILKEILTSLQNGEKSVKEALEDLESLPFKDIGYAKVDTHRDLRRGAPEAIYCEGKSESQITEIIDEMEPSNNLLATRVDPEVLKKIGQKYSNAHIYPESDLAFIGEFPEKTKGKIVVVTAGTTDIPVARKSEVTARSMGVQVDTIFDVGVSGLHRVLDFRDPIAKADMSIVVAGMEGALPSVVAGLVDTPVVAVPTDVGYGVNLDGIAPLLTMLNSCTPGITVVNIGDGYGAGYFAASVIKKIKK